MESIKKKGVVERGAKIVGRRQVPQFFFLQQLMRGAAVLHCQHLYCSQTLQNQNLLIPSR